MAMEKNKCWFVPVSGDKKLGGLSATYTEQRSCPDCCPMKNTICYAKNFPCCLQWKKAQIKGVYTNELENVVNTSPCSNVVRHNIAGDLSINGSNKIDADTVNDIVKAFAGKTVFTYTHCEICESNSEIIKNASNNNVIINYSTESINQAKKAMDQGCNAVIAVNSMEKNTVIVDGVKIVKCLNACNDNIKCANCGLCWKKNRSFVIAFPAHGTKKKNAKSFLIDL